MTSASDRPRRRRRCAKRRKSAASPLRIKSMKFTPYNFAQQDVSGERKSASACSALLSARRESSPNSALRRRDAKAQIKRHRHYREARSSGHLRRDRSGSRHRISRCQILYLTRKLAGRWKDSDGPSSAGRYGRAMMQASPRARIAAQSATPFRCVMGPARSR